MIRLRRHRVNRLFKMYVTHAKIERELRDQIRERGRPVKGDLKQHHELEELLLYYEAACTDREITAAVAQFNRTSH